MQTPQRKLISFMIPSRFRPEKLLDSIGTLLRQAGEANWPQLEILVKFDRDDTESLALIQKMPYDKVTTKVLISDRLGGYRDVFRFYNDMARVSTGQFLLLWNDDAKFETENWFELFSNVVRSEPSAYSYWFAGNKTTIIDPQTNTPRIDDWPSFVAHHRALYEMIGFYSGQGTADAFIYYVLDPLGLFKKIDNIRIRHEPWFQIPEKERDALAVLSSQQGSMQPTDMNLVRFCQQRIVNQVQRQNAERQAQQQREGKA